MFERELLEHTTFRPLKRTEYERLAEQGAFVDERVELLAGVIVSVSPQGVEHADLVMLLNELLVRSLPPAFQLRPQLPFALSDYSMPEPDLVVIPRKPFGSAHPSDSPWMIEVSASSLGIDRGLKARLYAAAGMPEYWIINAEDLQIEVHRNPSRRRYQSVETFDRHASVAPLAFPEIAICLDTLIATTAT
ncbi:MAG: Uma2 family endonuclease [Myxococcales bacterium]|nr:Uma2 family endonuclease [Myxococcales bacterium]